MYSQTPSPRPRLSRQPRSQSGARPGGPAGFPPAAAASEAGRRSGSNRKMSFYRNEFRINSAYSGNNSPIMACIFRKCGMMGPREAAAMDRVPPAPARCGTTPIQPTGEVRPPPASRARNQAHEPRRRETRARAGTGAHAVRAKQGPAAPGRRGAAPTPPSAMFAAFGAAAEKGTKTDRKEGSMSKRRSRGTRMRYPELEPEAKASCLEGQQDMPREHADHDIP